MRGRIRVNKYCVLELPKIPQDADGTDMWVWGKVIDSKTREELEMIAATYPQVKDVTVEILKLSKDERARALHEARVKQERDQMARDKFVMQSGMQQGMQQAMLSIAKKLLNRNTPIAYIIEDTGLTAEEIQALQ